MEIEKRSGLELSYVVGDEGVLGGGDRHVVIVDVGRRERGASLRSTGKGRADASIGRVALNLGFSGLAFCLSCKGESSSASGLEGTEALRSGGGRVTGVARVGGVWVDVVAGSWRSSRGGAAPEAR